MTTSIIGTSRVSINSVLATVTGVAGLVQNSVNSASLGMDILHAKVAAAHEAATLNSEQRTLFAREADTDNMLETHAQLLVDRAERLAKNPKLAKAYLELKKNLHAPK